MHSGIVFARRGALVFTLSALLFGAGAPGASDARAQSGRKSPEKARTTQPAAPGQPPAAQTPSEPVPPPTTEKDLRDAVELGVNVVDVETVVYNKKSGAIYGDLKPGNFEVYEDGIKQEIANFIPTQGPMTVVMLIEFSKRIDNYAIGKAEVLRPLYTLIGQGIKPEDNVAIVAFDTKPVVITDFTGNVKALNAGLNLLIQNNAAFSESNLYDALAFVLQGGKAEAVDFGGGGLVKGVDYGGLKSVESRSAVILVTLGVDTFSKLNYDEVRKVIADAGVPIYTLGVGNLFYKINDGRMSSEASMSWQQAFNTLATFSRMSGGKYFPVTFPGELPTTMQSITNLMRSQYSIGYTPSNTRHEGKLRKIEVKVDVDGDGKFDDKNVVVQHRESYIEPKDAAK
jgi:Ca-activated chloride channel family protein